MGWSTRWTTAAVTTMALGWAAGACSSASGPGEDGLEVRNEVQISLIVLAVDAETATVIDPAPELSVDDHLDRFVEPGGTLRIPLDEVVGELTAGEGVVLFVYDADQDPAPWLTGLAVSASELADAGYRVAIETGDLGG